MDHEKNVANLDGVARPHRRRCVPEQRFPRHARAVCAAEVGGQDAAGLDPKSQVLAGDGRMIDENIDAGSTSKDDVTELGQGMRHDSVTQEDPNRELSVRRSIAGFDRLLVGRGRAASAHGEKVTTRP
jgi:hypothetical protein